MKRNQQQIGIESEPSDKVQTFSPQEREQIRGELVAAAKADPRIVGAAHLGSAAIGELDRWSDIDLALCSAPDTDAEQTLRDWTTRLFRSYGAVATYDLRRGDILYRVFLLQNTLQIDLSFWPAGKLRATGLKFQLIFGAAEKPAPAPLPISSDLIGMAWLYALHVRSSIARARLLQAEYMLSGMRDNVLALICKRHGVADMQGRGLDDLPEPQKAQAAECLARSLEVGELTRAFRITMEMLLEELRRAGPEQAAKLERALSRIVDSLEAD